MGDVSTVLANPLPRAREGAILPADKTTVLVMAARQALIMLLNAVEDWLEMPHSVMDKDERHEFNRWKRRQAQAADH